ncbi:MAG TPA: gamma-glutamyl-gamma-aminobutyrate hydrolase family protein [Gemmatimonadaceae bacterium]|nr:gamma-glutamyl-gamma-aminobutyrate hydrolase family protein [Gemmatimonadaceae bacterium]
MTGQPIVAVTATSEMIRGAPRVRLNEAYVNAVTASGMIPLVVAPLDTGFAEIVARVDGLVLTGGEDVAPARYGAARHARTGDPHDARDRTEIALLTAAREARLPVLAICRGLQVANVALGGTLVQDLPSERPSATTHDRSDARTARVHEVRIAGGSRLSAATGAEMITVNSSHHQAIDRLAPGLAVTGNAPDGVVEGAEWVGDADWWMLGVQWHPEELVRTPPGWDRALFAAFRERVAAVHR